MLDLVRLKKGVTGAQLKKAALSEGDKEFKKIAEGGGDVTPFPGILAPGTHLGMITKLPAGHYGMVCFIPAASDGQPHVAHGMFKVFDVSSAKSTLTPPQDGVVDITLTDTAVTVPTTGIPGKGYAKITNKGATPRDFNLAQLFGTTTVAQADAYFTALFESGPPAGTPPAAIIGGAIAIPKGATTYLVLDFAKGRYAYASSNSEMENDPNEITAEFMIT